MLDFKHTLDFRLGFEKLKCRGWLHVDGEGWIQNECLSTRFPEHNSAHVHAERQPITHPIRCWQR